MQERERDLKRPVLTYNPHYRGKQLSLPRFDCLLGSESLSLSENLLDFLLGIHSIKHHLLFDTASVYGLWNVNKFTLPLVATMLH